MATRKGICPYCTIARIENRIFMVNPEASICFCPNCMHDMQPSEAIKAYDDYLRFLLHEADDSLYVSCDPETAYTDYANVIEIDETVTDAYLGRILCLLYMSKVRSNYLKEAQALLENEASTYLLKASELPKVIPFLKRVNHVLDDYSFVLNRRLSFKNKYFYDQACLSLYLQRMNEIYDFKNDLLKYCMVIRRKYGDQNIEVLINLLEHSLDELERLKEDDHLLTSGIYFKLVKYKRTGEAVIEKSEKKNTGLNSFKYIRFYTLDPNNKNKKCINDIVFKNYTKVIKSSKRAIFWYIFFYGLMLGAGAVAYFFRSDKLVLIIALAAAGLFFVLGTIILMLRLSWKKIIKKRRLAIDQ